jgi:hypothetical protein
LNVLIACEYSGEVRRAFEKKGHNVKSCDIIPSDDNSKNHLICDVKDILDQSWDLMIAFPPCTFLCVSGARWFKDRIPQQLEALEFVKLLMNVNIEKIAIENPIGVISTKIRKPNQIIQPWQFGHGETKATCLWLKNLPNLIPSNIVEGREQRIHKLAPSKTRSKERSKTFRGIAEAMADQWG